MQTIYHNSPTSFNIPTSNTTMSMSGMYPQNMMMNSAFSMPGSMMMPMSNISNLMSNSLYMPSNMGSMGNMNMYGMGNMNMMMNPFTMGMPSTMMTPAMNPGTTTSHDGHAATTTDSGGGGLLGGLLGGGSGGGFLGGLVGGLLSKDGLVGGLVGPIAGPVLGIFSQLVGHDSAYRAGQNGDVGGWLINTLDHSGHTHHAGGAEGHASSMGPAPLAIAGTLGQMAGGLVGLDKLFGSATAYDQQHGTNYVMGGNPNYGGENGGGLLGGLLGGML